MTTSTGTRMQQLGYRAPDAVPEPEQLVLVDYVSEGRIAVVTLNRPHALNAVTTALAAQLIEILETISAGHASGWRSSRARATRRSRLAGTCTSASR